MIRAAAKLAPSWSAGVATDAGLLRPHNEDRAYANEASGLFLVVDGMGGHAAGDKAAETAVEIIPAQMQALKGSIENRIRRAITAANNEIHRLSEEREELTGMACVLTLAAAHDDKLTVGHVGDSRLYLAFTGGLRKLTSDHSPVGEREDRGDLTEEEAMRDPRRNQVFRDVGSLPHEPGDPNFIEIRSYPFRADAAFLLCTDGLSDALTSAEMNAIVQQYDGDPQRVAQGLVDAANGTGGKDNVTAVFVAGPEFAGTRGRATIEARARHSITRMRRGGALKRAIVRLLWLLAGAVLGIAGLISSERFFPRPAPQPVAEVPGPRHVMVDPADPRSLGAALTGARAGDTIEVPKGEYLGPLQLKDGVDLISLDPGAAVIHVDADAQANAGVAVVARNLKAGRFTGFLISGTDARPLTTGLLIADSNLEVDEVEIVGAKDFGIRIEGSSAPVIRASYIHANAGGVLVEGQSAPRLTANRITGNAAAIEIRDSARPQLVNNTMDASPRPRQRK